jgi:hypothetical protein
VPASGRTRLCTPRALCRYGRESCCRGDSSSKARARIAHELFKCRSVVCILVLLRPKPCRVQLFAPRRIPAGHCAHQTEHACGCPTTHINCAHIICTHLDLLCSLRSNKCLGDVSIYLNCLTHRRDCSPFKSKRSSTMGKGAGVNLPVDQTGMESDLMCSDGGFLPVKRSFNFCAGPAMLDSDAMATMWRDFCSWQGSGVSLIEMSQRDKGGPVQTMISDAVGNIRKLLSVPANYKILLFQVLKRSVAVLRFSV